MKIKLTADELIHMVCDCKQIRSNLDKSNSNMCQYCVLNRVCDDMCVVDVLPGSLFNVVDENVIKEAE